MKSIMSCLAVLAVLSATACAQAPSRPGLIQEEPNASTRPPQHQHGAGEGQKPWEPLVTPGILVVAGVTYLLITRRKR